MSISSAKLKKLPDAPGVYFFLGKRKLAKLPNAQFPKARPYPHLSTLHAPQGRALGRVINRRDGREVLYIGKAGSLRDRVRSYFSKDIAEMRGPSITQMVAKAEDVAYEQTDSVLEAVLLEAELIRKYQPKYNVREKDDKSFNFVVITDEDFPRVLLVRGRELSLYPNRYKPKARFGPFPQGGTLRAALAIIRKIFPYRDKCVPLHHSNILQNIRINSSENREMCQDKEHKKLLRKSAFSLRSSAPKPCFGRQIGLCPGVCTGEVSKKEYAKTVQNITALFRGKKKDILRNLTREMSAAARAEDFEKAGARRNTIFALKHIQDVSLLRRESLPVPVSQRPAPRIEAYDVAHTSGKEIVGVMTVVHNGEPDKNAYRKFILRTVLSANDPAALKEVMERRLTHAEWPFPALVVVDGGKAQVNVATRVLEESGVPAAIVGVVKDERHRPKQIIGDEGARKKFENEILLANVEAHRFAISFHRERMRKRS